MGSMPPSLIVPRHISHNVLNCGQTAIIKSLDLLGHKA